MTQGTNRYVALILTVLLFMSCVRGVVFTESVSMPGKTWKLDDIPAFSIPVKDTLTGNDIFFILRTSSSYPFRNIYLFATTTSPDGHRITDTLQYTLADEKGNWYGKGFGDIHELKLPYKSNVFFPVSGIYQVNVQHGMRTEDLKGVYDIGIRVDKTTKK
jgi:gliding motility-associated lipoprotein GldH